MTAAYMTRCIYLTFFGESAGAPTTIRTSRRGRSRSRSSCSRCSPWSPACSTRAFDIELFTDWFEPQFVSNVVTHHGFDGGLALLGTAAGVLGIASAGLYYFRQIGPRRVTERVAVARAGYTFLANKYYLDHLYTDGIVGGIKGPIARLAYWINQNVIDGVVNGTAALAGVLGRFSYDVIDQSVVDGAVNGAGASAEAGGSALRTLQTGRVQQYAAVLFGAVVVFAVALWQFT